MKVVVEILRRGLLERKHLATLRIDARHDVLDGAVLAGRIHRLKHQQQRPAVLGVEHVLLLGEPLGAALEQIRRVVLVEIEAAGVGGIEILQAKALALGNAERVDVVLDALEDLVSCHDASLSSSAV